MSRPSRAGYGPPRRDNPPRHRPTTHPDDDDRDPSEEEEVGSSSSRQLNRGPAQLSQDGGQRRPAQTPSLQGIEVESSSPRHLNRDPAQPSQVSGQRRPAQTPALQGTEVESSSPRHPNRGQAQPPEDGGQRRPAQTPSLQAIAPMIAAFMDTSPNNYRSMAEVVWDNEALLREAFEVQFEENARRSLLKGERERERALRYVQLARFVNWKYNMPRRNIEEMAMKSNSPITDNFRQAALERFAWIAHSVRDSATSSRTSQQTSAPRPAANIASDPDRRYTSQTAAARGAATLVGNREMPRAQPQQLLRNTGDRVSMPPTSRHATQPSERRLQDPTVMAPSRQRLPLNASTNRPSELRSLKPPNRYSDDDVIHPSEPPNSRLPNRYSEDYTDGPFDAHDPRLANQYHEDHVDASHDQIDDHGYLEDDNYLKGQSGNYDDVPDSNGYEAENRIRSSIPTSKPVSRPRAQAAYSNSKLPNTTISRTTTRSPPTNSSTADHDEEPASDEVEDEHHDGEGSLPRSSRANQSTAGRAGTLPSGNGNYPYTQRNYDTREKPRTSTSSNLPYRQPAPNRRSSPPQKPRVTR